MKSVLPNILFTFWAACMWVNYKSIKKGIRIDMSSEHGHTLRKYMEQGHMYLGLFSSCIVFILLNNVTSQYNKRNWCEGESYAFAVANVDKYNEFRSYFHYVLTLANMLIYSQAAGLFSTLSRFYEFNKNALLEKQQPPPA